MNVQPYFPEPETVPGNVATDKYDVRLVFVRWVVFFHALTVGTVAWIAATTPASALWQPYAKSSLLLLVCLSVVRKIPNADRIFSLLFFPSLLFALGRLIGALPDFSLMFASWGVAACMALLYSLICGRDFSFTGQYVLAGLGTVFVLFVVRQSYSISSEDLVLAVFSALAFLFYYVYDLASLLQRRRHDQVLLAVTDLYRDVLNIFSYTFRVIQHWRRFNI